MVLVNRRRRTFDHSTEVSEECIMRQMQASLLALETEEALGPWEAGGL